MTVNPIFNKDCFPLLDANPSFAATGAHNFGFAGRNTQFSRDNDLLTVELIVLRQFICELWMQSSLFEQYRHSHVTTVKCEA